MQRDESRMLKYRLHSPSNPGKFICIAKCEIDGRETFISQTLEGETDTEASMYFDEFLGKVFGEYDVIFDIEIFPMENVAAMESESWIAKMMDIIGNANEST